MDWEEAARQLESRFDFSRIPGSVAKRLDSAGVLHVACSGGADSVFVLLLVRAYLKKRDKLSALRVLHFDHALRGDASKEDAAFVRGICGALRIPFLDARAEWPTDAGKVNEAMARDSRLAFFLEATGASVEQPVAIATGHHADDVVETMLMRLSRGAGLQGLCAPREVSEAGGGLVFLRPALDWSREEIHDALSASGVRWREDETNASDLNYRARLRKEAIPSWGSASDRPIRPGVGRSRRMLAEDAEALDFAAEYFWNRSWGVSDGALRRSEVESLPQGIQRRLLLRLPFGAGVAADALDWALAAVRSGEVLKLEVGPGLFYEFSSEWLRLRRAQPIPEVVDWGAFSLPVGTVAFLPDGSKLTCSIVAMDESLRKRVISGSNDDCQIVYLDTIGNSPSRLVVRKRAAGDAFRPLGKTSPKKLKNLFIDRKIDRTERDRLPVFVDEEFGILWVPGLPPNADKKLGFASKAALRLTYER